MQSVEVVIQLKPTLMDAQGATISKALHNLGYDNVKGVRIGKFIELEVEGEDAEQVEAQVREMCEKLLANPIIEDYQVKAPAGNPHPEVRKPRAAYTMSKELPDPDAFEDWRGFHMTYEELTEMSDEEQMALGMEVWQKHEDWIHGKLNEYNAQWIMMVGGRVVRWSETIEDCPTAVEGLKYAQETNQLPWVFPRPILIDEMPWSSVSNEDYYPTIEVCLTGKEASPAGVTTELQLIGDLDTGSPHCFLNYDDLNRSGLIEPALKPMTYLSQHLGERFFYYKLPLFMRIARTSRDPEQIVCNCIPSWHHSPLRKTNPNRKALFGRNLLLRLQLVVKLDGRNRKTEILPE